ncbi:hypothetical protein L2E82_14933 [Cichorium intybus]|uniref:Uncharacterized protein n=1 Tax=Cichorium intybus TaxID=13427 RepID=A0ACB9F1S0_CICIN|nr:hypothetical protein L2E82_14933 [Cichorium intybus]
MGTYLATIHKQAAAVWGVASTFNRLMCYAHPQVKLIDFSPVESIDLSSSLRILRSRRAKKEETLHFEGNTLQLSI